MERLITILQLSDVYSFEEINEAIVCNLNQDKVLIIKIINSLDEVNELATSLPSLKEKIRERMVNEKNMTGIKEDVRLSKFLWDMYIVGLHEYSCAEDKFNEFDVARFQRDRFVARKIIIEYTSDEDLLNQFNQLVLPERSLDEVLNSFTSQETEYGADELDAMLRHINDITR